jgi:hypothetical protein
MSREANNSFLIKSLLRTSPANRASNNFTSFEWSLNDHHHTIVGTNSGSSNNNNSRQFTVSSKPARHLAWPGSGEPATPLSAHQYACTNAHPAASVALNQPVRQLELWGRMCAPEVIDLSLNKRNERGCSAIVGGELDLSVLDCLGHRDGREQLQAGGELERTSTILAPVKPNVKNSSNDDRHSHHRHHHRHHPDNNHHHNQQQQQDEQVKSRRRTRTMFSDWQLGELEWRFSRNKYLITSDRHRLAKLLSLDQMQVKTWFQVSAGESRRRAVLCDDTGAISCRIDRVRDR